MFAFVIFKWSEAVAIETAHDLATVTLVIGMLTADIPAVDGTSLH